MANRGNFLLSAAVAVRTAALGAYLVLSLGVEDRRHTSGNGSSWSSFCFWCGRLSACWKLMVDVLFCVLMLLTVGLSVGVAARGGYY